MKVVASGGDGGNRHGGPIAYMVRNEVAANLLMFFILAAGFVSVKGLAQEVLPEIFMDRIIVSVRYPGATPDEVEESIVCKIKDRIESVEGIKRVRFNGANSMPPIGPPLFRRHFLLLLRLKPSARVPGRNPLPPGGSCDRVSSC